MGASLLFILMNLIPMITAICFSIVLGETKSLGEFFKMVFFQKESNLSWMLAFFPIYQLPWITAGSSNYLIFYLMILGNTFLFGALKEYSKGAVPCILSHMLIDSLAVLMLVQSSLPQIILLVIIEILVSSWLVAIRKS